MTNDCITCMHKEGSCYPSTTIFDKDKTCKSYNPDYKGYIGELEKKNAELKEKLEELQKQKEYWRESSFDWRHKFFGKENTKRLVQKDKELTKAKELADVQKGQLTEAKELLKWWVNHCGNHDLHYAKKTEQFLRR